MDSTLDLPLLLHFARSFYRVGAPSLVSGENIAKLLYGETCLFSMALHQVLVCQDPRLFLVMTAFKMHVVAIAKKLVPFPGILMLNDLFCVFGTCKQKGIYRIRSSLRPAGKLPLEVGNGLAPCFQLPVEALDLFFCLPGQDGLLLEF